MTPSQLIALFLVLSLVCFALVVAFREIPWIYILLWPGYIYLIMVIAYKCNLPMLFAKRRATGELSWPTAIVFAPYLLIVRCAWYKRMLFDNEPPYHMIVDGL